MGHVGQQAGSGDRVVASHAMPLSSSQRRHDCSASGDGSDVLCSPLSWTSPVAPVCAAFESPSHSTMRW